ncbi:MAG TPA: hypothetical protein ENN80_09475 [Candidatus Hydrogenedentes bacterium]|nr:hypothetical protein [Candidatus Hydrogenedentota bacterium]
MKTRLLHTLRLVAPLALVACTTGCPYMPNFLEEDPEYAVGFGVGFLEDDWYWKGFDDGYETVDGGPIYYAGNEIPYVASPPYEAGYWDGVWQAYNDGYFVDYDYAFTIGFSEGYDAAFAADYLDFIAVDQHIEWLDGGWSDGYNDGFSEGKIFGANDFETKLPFDWLDGMLDYRAGTDLYFEEVDLGTGIYGPVVLYEYGTDPFTLIEGKTALPRLRVLGKGRSIRAQLVPKAKAFEPPELSYRALDGHRPEVFGDTPTTSARGDRSLTLTTTWGERVDAYVSALESPTKDRTMTRVRAR